MPICFCHVHFALPSRGTVPRTRSKDQIVIILFSYLQAEARIQRRYVSNVQWRIKIVVIILSMNDMVKSPGSSLVQRIRRRHT